MSDKIVKTVTVTPLSIETKELLSKKTGEPYQKVEITCEMPKAGKVWMKAWPEDCAGIQVGVPFEAEVTATPKDQGGYFYDFKPLRGATARVAAQEATHESTLTPGMDDKIWRARVEGKIDRLTALVEALTAEKEIDGIRF